MDTIRPEALKSTYNLDLSDSDLLIIDVREPFEYAHERIPHSINVPLNEIGKKDFSVFKNKTVVFHCRSGNRTKLNEQILASTSFKQKYCLDGGLIAWKAAGLPTEKMAVAPIDIMRQVQVIVSTMILSGLGLSHFISPYFLALPLIAGIGLMVAGLTGFCGMAILLSHAPWNKAAARNCQQAKCC
jgi:rhodanese-related sulfurtransferase